MPETLVLIAVVLIVYTYFGYPIILKLLSTDEKGVPLREVSYPTLSIIISVHNEEAVISEKISNTLSLEYPREKLQIIVSSDSSVDRTDEIVSSYVEKGVQLVRTTERLGKENAQRTALESATGDIIFFTDAKVMLEPEALENVVQYFNDSSVGAVSSIDIISGDGGEGAYVRYEMWLRELESRFHSLVGLSGSCFAVRKKVADQLRTDIPSDFGLLLASVRSGLRGVLAPNVRCLYKTVKSEKEEFPRKVRTVVRGITAFMSAAEVLNPFKYGVFAWQVVSHKLFRWLVPLFILLAYIPSVLFFSQSAFLTLVAFGGTIGFGAAAVGYLIEPTQNIRLIRLCLFFVISNAAIAYAWILFLKGERITMWKPSER